MNGDVQIVRTQWLRRLAECPGHRPLSSAVHNILHMWSTSTTRLHSLMITTSLLVLILKPSASQCAHAFISLGGGFLVLEVCHFFFSYTEPDKLSISPREQCPWCLRYMALSLSSGPLTSETAAYADLPSIRFQGMLFPLPLETDMSCATYFSSRKRRSLSTYIFMATAPFCPQHEVRYVAHSYTTGPTGEQNQQGRIFRSKMVHDWWS